MYIWELTRVHVSIILCHRRQCQSFSFFLNCHWKIKTMINTIVKITMIQVYFTSFIINHMMHIDILKIWTKQNKFWPYPIEEKIRFKVIPQISFKPTSTSLSVNFVWVFSLSSMLLALYSVCSFEGFSVFDNIFKWKREERIIF